MRDTIMNELQEAINKINGEENADITIRNYIDKVCEDLDYSVVKNIDDSDLRIKLNANCIGTNDMDELNTIFKITYINVNDEDELEIDLELKND